MFDWLSHLIKSLWSAIKATIVSLWTDFYNFITELPALVLESVLKAISSLFSELPVPSFLEQGLSGLFSDLDPSVLYFLGQSGVFEGFAIYGTGVAFRLLRKIFTLGQW